MVCLDFFPFTPTLLKSLSSRCLLELCLSSKDICNSIFATQVLVLKIKLDNQIEINWGGGWCGEGRYTTTVNFFSGEGKHVSAIGQSCLENSKYKDGRFSDTYSLCAFPCHLHEHCLSTWWLSWPKLCCSKLSSRKTEMEFRIQLRQHLSLYLLLSSECLLMWTMGREACRHNSSHSKDFGGICNTGSMCL